MKKLVRNGIIASIVSFAVFTSCKDNNNDEMETETTEVTVTTEEELTTTATDTLKAE
ncbi:MAG: hypothetical protein ITG00_04730 [Flavobacterium sp.]|nr:hypothetical protein [Flavobacterium sp.]